MAAFVPADAKLDQPTPSPSEPLGDGAADVNGDVPMNDAPDPLPENVVAPENVAQASDSPRQQLTPPPDQAVVPDIGGVGSLQPALTPSRAPPDIGLAKPAAGEPESSSVASVNQNDAVSASAGPNSNGTEVAPVPTKQSPPDSNMSSSTSLTRARDEDGAADEPSAKRARLEDSEASTLPVAALPQVSESTSETASRPLTTSAPPPSLEPPLQPSVTSAPPPATAAAAPPAIPPSASAALPAPLPAPNGATPGQLPGRSQYSTEPLTKLQKKLVEEKLKNTKKVKSAGPFLRPVDAVALNIPHYTNVIKHPMDIATMEHKLKTDQYESLESFVSDFELMVSNCFTFNGPAHAVSVMAQNLRAYFLKQMDSVPTGTNASALPQKPVKKESPAAKPLPRRESRASTGPSVAKSPVATDDRYALMPTGVPQIRRDSTAGRPKRTVIPPPSRDLPYSGSKPKRKENQAGLKFCDHVLDEMRKPKYHQMTMFFLEPVDPVALNIPHYFSIIKHPMDLSTITNKQKNGQYSSADDFKADIDLMLSNCFKFNPPENGVHIAGKQLQSEFEALWKTKGDWVKRNQPRSQRVTPASDESASEEESSEDEAANGDDEKEATIRALKEQLATMQNMLGAISGVKRESPKASSKKKSRTSTGGASKSKKSSGAAAVKVSTKAKNNKKQRLVSYEEKQEISNATENMTEEQANKLTAIITENVAKYKVSEYIIYPLGTRLTSIRRT